MATPPKQTKPGATRAAKTNGTRAAARQKEGSTRTAGRVKANGNRVAARDGGGAGTRVAAGNGGRTGSTAVLAPTPDRVTDEALESLLSALLAAREGDFTKRLSARRRGIMGEIASAYNEVVELNGRMAKELDRVRRVVGREGKMHERANLRGAGGAWASSMESVSSLIDDLVRPTTEVARVIVAVAEGDLTQKMALEIEGQPVKGEFLRIGTTVNAMLDQLSSFADEVSRVAREVGTEGKLGGQARVEGVSGTWKDLTENVNYMASNLTDQVRNIAVVTTAVANGDLSQKITVDAKGEILELKNTINTMVDQLSSFADEVTRVAREVGTEGILGGQAVVPGAAGTWKGLTDNVNSMASNLTDQVRGIVKVVTAVANGDLGQKFVVEAKGEVAALAETINSMTDTLRVFAEQVTGVAREVGTEGKLGGQAEVPGVAGTWKDLTENVNLMAGNLTDQVRNIAQVTTAVANGDLSQKITVDVKGEILELKNTINTMVDQLSSFADEVTRVAREVGTEGRLGGQAEVEDVSGTWRGLTESVNFMASNLTDQVRNIAVVTTAVANGDLSQKIEVEAKGEVAALAETINSMTDTLRLFAEQVTSVAREVGTEGKLGGQAEVPGVAGTWKDLTENVNLMAGNLTDQVRSIAQVTTAVANGDLSQKIEVEAKGEVAALAETINRMVDQLSSFAAEVTRVAREVGTEGRLGGQAEVEGVSGTWRDLTENVNQLAGNLTDQVRNIAQVTTAVANGDLSQKITVDAKGEILQLKNTINTMVDQLSSFADEVTRVAREVGTEGKLGGQAEVEGVSGTWRGLTENVNQLASNLTTQVRAIAEVSTAVTQGDLTRSITVEAQGEVAELKDNINQMIANLRDTTQKNAEQDWLKTNLARISGLMQGQRDLQTVTRLIMSELTPSVSAQHGAFFLSQTVNDSDPKLRLVASYGYKKRKTVSNVFDFGEGLVGQAALERKTIMLTQAPEDYIKVTSGLGESAPVNIVVMPVLFEDQVLGVIELGSLQPFSEVFQMFLDQLMETIGVVLNTIMANMRTEELLEQSQSLAQELQSQSEELQSQQDELRRSNAELEEQAKSLKASEELLQSQQEELQQTNEELQEKAALLAEQKRDIEIKNSEVEQARRGLEEKAEQLALSSKYKSEFLANMSHELRTPLNSLLILSKLLEENDDGNLTDKQREFASNIHAAGSDLLSLINDILDLSKVEAGKMDVVPAPVALRDVAASVERSFEPVAQQKGLSLVVEFAEDTPDAIVTDEQRLYQVLKNLVSNAVKFTRKGEVRLRISSAAAEGGAYPPELVRPAESVAFAVSDTGIGIARDKLQLIFEAFQQADGTTSRRYGGTGLGLSISREIARLLGGELRAESEERVGSTFTLFLPLRYVPVEPVIATEPTVAPEAVIVPSQAPTFTAQDGGDGETAVPEPLLLLPNELDDDRGAIGQTDRVVLMIIPDLDEARLALGTAREHNFRGLVAVHADAGLTLAQEFSPDAIVLDLALPAPGGMAVLEDLKRQPATRHIPIYAIADADQVVEALRTGAFACTERPADTNRFATMFEEITKFIEEPVRHLLIVEDNEIERANIAELIGIGDDVSVTAVGSSEEALAALGERDFHCVVLDLKLPDGDGFALLDRVKKDARTRQVPVIIYTAKDLTRREETRLRKLAETIIVKDVRSPERLLDETALFLHRAEARLPVQQRRVLEGLHQVDAVFEGKKVLIVDDDVRNVFALTSALEAHGMNVCFAENGRDGLAVLEEHPDVDVVLMDIMMPDMDGYQTTLAIREMSAFERLPIIALTAKAMKGDREKSIAAGASDYITKPVNVEQLLSLMRVWLYQQ